MVIPSPPTQRSWSAASRRMDPAAPSCGTREVSSTESHAQAPVPGPGAVSTSAGRVWIPTCEK
eukprot:1118378-Prorocentrum_minimum.AAC.1